MSGEVFTLLGFAGKLHAIGRDMEELGPAIVDADGGILRVDLVHEDEWNSMRCFAFYGKGNPCAPVSLSARLPSDFTRTYGGSGHVTGRASFEAETHNQSRRREGAGRRRT